MKPLFGVFVLALASIAPPTPHALDTVRNERMAYVLMNVQVLRETSAEERKAFHVRLLMVPEHGECGGSPETCPKVELFIAVSSIDEYPDQRVYQLSKRHDWRFVRWNRLPETDGPSDYVEFTLEADDPGPKPETEWWRTTRYDVKVNYRDGTITEHRAG